MPLGIIAVDLGFGDAGKGTVVDYLTRTTGAHTVLRFNGGPQAGHNVVTDDGLHHTFSQFGSGTFVQGVQTILAGPVLIEPYAMLREDAHLAAVGVPDALDRLEVDRRCRVITPVHVAGNRIREWARGEAAHGTCGMGVGEAAADSIIRPELSLFAADLTSVDTVVRKLRAVREWKLQSMSDLGKVALLDRGTAGSSGNPLPAEAAGPASVNSPMGTDLDWELLTDDGWIDTAVEKYRAAASRFRLTDADRIARRVAGPGVSIFEGAQGVLLDEHVGFHPHTTWSDTTAGNAMAILGRAGVTAVRRIGVVRTYSTRHGAGPMVTEDLSLKAVLAEPHNGDTGPQGRFRVGHFDAAATRYALRQCPVDEIAVTHLDRLKTLPAVVCDRYAGDGFGLGPDGEIGLIRRDDFTGRSEQTRTLSGCKPVLVERPADRDGFLSDLSIRLGVRIGIVSTGPTAAQKQDMSKNRVAV